MVEQAAVMMGIIEARQVLAGRDVIWYEDNSVVLSGLVKGANGQAGLDQGSSCIHLALAMLRTRVWWEYIESKANWSDEASRGGDLLLHWNGFQYTTADIPTWPWTTSAEELVEVVRQHILH